MTMEQAGEGKLAYMLRRGGAESIVFLHGLGASKGSFKPCFGLDFFKDYTLATVSSGKPHCSLMAYSARNDCSEIYRDTPRTI